MKSNLSADEYDEAVVKGGWDSPQRAQSLVGPYVTKGVLVLDIGIGTGLAIKDYTDKGARVVGLDHDPDMLAAAQLVTGTSGAMRLSDINDRWSIEDISGQVGIVQAIGVLEFASDLGDVIDQVQTSLKPKGLFVFTVETPGSSTDDLVQHYPDAGLTIYHHTADEVRQLLDSRGFELLKDEAYGGYVRDDTTGKVPYHIFLARNK